MFNSNVSISSRTLALTAAALSIGFAACVQQPASNTTNVAISNQSAVNAVANANTNSAPAQPANAELAKMPLTMPVVDAIMADESAVAEMKTKLQLSDEQINKLRDAARESTGKLGEDGDEGRSTEASTREATARIREIVGADKSDAVISFFKERWAGAGGDMASAATPNAVPTDTRVVVNAPAYRMDIFRDGKLTKTYKIGIGYPEFPLPAGMRKASEIIFNPTWTPPDEPWVKGKFEPGKKVAAGSKDNPLGPIKIPIGSPSLIHGGKSVARLGSFASHGCVGLTNAQIQDFAAEISGLSGEAIPIADVKAYEKNATETKNVKLKTPVNIELRYETIVVTTDGKLTIYRDVYERGTNTEENLQRVLSAAGVTFESLTPDDQQKILAGLKQMAFDATGDAVDTADAVTAGDKEAMKKQPAKVTKNIKGTKQIAFDIAALKGRGYPVAVNLKAA